MSSVQPAVYLDMDTVDLVDNASSVKTLCNSAITKFAADHKGIHYGRDGNKTIGGINFTQLANDISCLKTGLTLSDVLAALGSLYAKTPVALKEAVAHHAQNALQAIVFQLVAHEVDSAIEDDWNPDPARCRYEQALDGMQPSGHMTLLKQHYAAGMRKDFRYRPREVIRFAAALYETTTGINLCKELLTKVQTHAPMELLGIIEAGLNGAAVGGVFGGANGLMMSALAKHGAALITERLSGPQSAPLLAAWHNPAIASQIVGTFGKTETTWKHALPVMRTLFPALIPA